MQDVRGLTVMGVFYLQQSSWWSCLFLLWTSETPMSPAGPHRCSWQVCHPSTLQPRAATHTLLAHLSSSHTPSLAAYTHKHTHLKNYTDRSASSEKNLKGWPLLFVSLGHLNDFNSSVLVLHPALLQAIYAHCNFLTKIHVSTSTAKISIRSPKRTSTRSWVLRS